LLLIIDKRRYFFIWVQIYLFFLKATRDRARKAQVASAI